MFCPRCAAENVETAQFCRSCGANISLVPQAVAGQLPKSDGGDENLSSRDRRHRERHGEAVTIERAVRGVFMSIAFIFVAFAVKNWAPAGNIWWFWMFLPAAAMLADGVGAYLRLREKRQAGALPPSTYQAAPPSFTPPARAAELPPRNTDELVPPLSVTEGTTRHLATPPKRRREEA
jgi:hypothetical protein